MVSVSTVNRVAAGAIYTGNGRVIKTIVVTAMAVRRFYLVGKFVTAIHRRYQRGQVHQGAGTIRVSRILESIFNIGSRFKPFNWLIVHVCTKGSPFEI